MEALTVELNPYQALGVAAAVLVIGRFLIKKLPLLSRYCIPAPVVGGLIFALLNLLGHETRTLCITFDGTFQTFFMTVFYCTVGFSASFKMLKKGGLQVLIFLMITCLLCFLQNGIGCFLAGVFGLDRKLGLAMGSIPLVGGHGTSGSFGPLLEGLGVTGAYTVAMASATFGLVAGSVIGGPIAKRRIEKLGINLVNEASAKAASSLENDAVPLVKERFLNAALWLSMAIGIGTLIYNFFISVKITFPTYIGAMIMGCIIRNVTDAKHIDMPLPEIECLGHISLSLFLSLALMGLKLWQLADLAVPMIVILLAQVIMMAAFAYFAVFGLMGRDYEAACFASGTCGFGMGATPNAIANIDAVNRKYGPSPRAMFVIPLVGALFIDFCNSLIITVFLNFLR